MLFVREVVREDVKEDEDRRVMQCNANDLKRLKEGNKDFSCLLKSIKVRGRLKSLLIQADFGAEVKNMKTLRMFFCLSVCHSLYVVFTHHYLEIKIFLFVSYLSEGRMYFSEQFLFLSS